MEPADPGPRTGPPRRPSRHSVDSSRRRQLLVALLSVIAGSADVLSFLVGRPVRCPRYRERGHPRRPPGHQEPEQSLARDLPETALRAASRSLTTQPSAAPATCSVAWVGKVAQGHVNRPRIDGKDGVAGSIPAGGSTRTPQVRPGVAPGLSRDQEPATAFAREFARLSCTF